MKKYYTKSQDTSSMRNDPAARWLKQQDSKRKNRRRNKASLKAPFPESSLALQPKLSSKALFVPNDKCAVVCLCCGHVGLVPLDIPKGKKLRCTVCTAIAGTM